jgi:hypothetical protein
MVDNVTAKKSRGSFPDSLIARRIDFEGFARSLVKKMGFADSKKTTKPSRPKRIYFYEDTGIINESINQALAMFPESYGSITPSQQATIIPLSSPRAQQTTAAPSHEFHAYTSQPGPTGADVYKDTGSIGAVTDTPMAPATGQSQPAFTPSEQKDAEPPQTLPLTGLVTMSQISSRWELLSTEVDFDEVPDPQPKKKRFRFFRPTRGAHVRFIFIILGVLLLYVLILGFLSYRGVLNIGI